MTTTKKLGVREQRQVLLDKALLAVDGANEALDELFNDLEEKRSNMEEKFSSTERYALFEEACNAVQKALDNLSNIELDIELP